MQVYLVNLNQLQNLGGVPDIAKLEAEGQPKGAHGGNGCQTSAFTGKTTCPKNGSTGSATAPNGPSGQGQQFGIGTQTFGGSGGSGG